MVNVTARTQHGYPVLGSCLRAAAPDPARYCWYATHKTATQATKSRLKLPGIFTVLALPYSTSALPSSTSALSGSASVLATWLYHLLYLALPDSASALPGSIPGSGHLCSTWALPVSTSAPPESTSAPPGSTWRST